MNNNRFLKSDNIFAFLSFFILCVIIINFITGFMLIPKEIKLIEGSAKELNFNLPIKATIEPEKHSVLKVNNEPVKENITIDLIDSVVIEPESFGQATMTLNAFGFPVKTVVLDILPNMEVIPCGNTIGVRISTAGVMVLGTGLVAGDDGKPHNPSDGVLKSGDLILKANNKELDTKEQLIEIIKNSDSEVSLQVKRQNDIIDTSITPVISDENKEKKIGVWVRDGTQGIGTITYYNPETNKFAALGHGILDIDTKQIMSIKEGEIMESEIVSVIKGKKGVPGELIGEVKKGNVIGKVEKNSPFGIFGSVNINAKGSLPNKKYKIALQDTIHEGPATIRSTVDKGTVKDYDIYIESVNRLSSDDTKGMVIRITDPELIKKTNGIVQGMSGSPILQDNNLIGAVTHVFVQEPTKGYGIFIENMLKNEN